MKNKLNYELLEFHIREAADELDSLLRRIQFMLGRLDKAGELQVDAWGDLNEAGLEVSLVHAYHHMNFAWNVRNKTTKEADRNFDRDEKFPRTYRKVLRKKHPSHAVRGEAQHGLRLRPALQVELKTVILPTNHKKVLA